MAGRSGKNLTPSLACRISDEKLNSVKKKNKQEKAVGGWNKPRKRPWEAGNKRCEGLGGLGQAAWRIGGVGGVWKVFSGSGKGLGAAWRPGD